MYKKKKIYNKKQSQLRIIAEHTICRIKKFGIMGNKFKNNLGRYDNVSNVYFRTGKFQVMRINGIM